MLPMLKAIRAMLDASVEPDRELVWAVVALAFFGFFRLGELLLDRGWAYSHMTHLSWSDVAIDDCDEPTAIRIHLKQSKCDQFGRGVDVFVGRTGNEVCPVAAVLAYLAVRGSMAGPLFIDTQQQPLTKPRFVARIRSILEDAYLRPDSL